jgi:hypothetical protein
VLHCLAINQPAAGSKLLAAVSPTAMAGTLTCFAPQSNLGTTLERSDHTVGTVIAGDTCPPLDSVRVNRNIRNGNMPFEPRSRPSIKNQWSRFLIVCRRE